MNTILKCASLACVLVWGGVLEASDRTQIYHIMAPKTLDVAEKLMSEGFAEGGDGVCLDLCKLEAGVRTEESFRRLVKHAAGHPIYFCLYKWDPILKGDDVARMKVLMQAAKAGAAIVDMPADLYKASPRELTRDAAAIERQRATAAELHKLGVTVIVSSHMQVSLKAEEILEHFQRQAERGADIVKIVHKVDTDAELAETERAMREMHASFPKKWLLLGSGKKGHEVRLKGCDYGCAIEFSVTDGDTRETFKEQPTIREFRKRMNLGNRPLRVAHIGDPQFGFITRNLAHRSAERSTTVYAEDKARFERLIPLVNAEHPDVVVIAGDLTQKSEDMTREWPELLTRFEAPVLVTAGNHDLGNNATRANAERFRSTVGCLWKRLDIAGWRLICGNSQFWRKTVDCPELKADYEAWLKAELAAAKKEVPVGRLVAISHVPPFAHQYEEKDGYDSCPMADRRQKLDAWLDAGARFWLAGHTHRMSVHAYRELTILNAEATCDSFDLRPSGFRILELHDDGTWSSRFVK